MTLASSSDPADRASLRILAIGIALAMEFALVFLAGRAEAAQGSTSAGTEAADLCSAARNVASDLTHSTTVTQGIVTPAGLKARSSRPWRSRRSWPRSRCRCSTTTSRTPARSRCKQRQQPAPPYDLRCEAL